jgi:hypothetical protein
VCRNRVPTKKPERKTISSTAGGYLQDPAAFHYSKAIAGSGTVGDEQTPDPFLAAPRKLFPGTSMPVSLRSAQDHADVIAYSTLSRVASLTHVAGRLALISGDGAIK